MILYHLLLNALPSSTNSSLIRRTANLQQYSQIPQSKPTIPTNQQSSSSSEQRLISFLRPPFAINHPLSTSTTQKRLPVCCGSHPPQIPQSKPTNGAYSPIQTKFISSTPLTHNSHTLILLKLPKNPKSKNSHHRPNFHVLASANPNGSDGFSWLSLTRSVRRGSERLWSKLGKSRKKETGFCLEDANVKVGEFVGRAKEGVNKGRGELEWFRIESVPEFVSWNQWEPWKLSRFIAAGKLHCKIDKVAGVLETNRPDAKNSLYQATIKQGDFLLNWIQKLYRVVDL